VIRLIGVNHRIQWKKPPWINAYVPREVRDDQTQYSSLIESFLCEFSPAVVAEEYTERQLKESKTQSILLAIKEAYEANHGTKIIHVFAEPESAEKRARGYKEQDVIEALLKRRLHINPTPEQTMAHVIAHQHPIRERLWLDRISEHMSNEIFFVCGDIHLITFSKLLERERIDHKVIASRIGVRNLDTLEYRALKFAQDNNMFGETDCYCLKG
jgi:hypothetical protein